MAAAVEADAATGGPPAGASGCAGEPGTESAALPLLAPPPSTDMDVASPCAMQDSEASKTLQASVHRVPCVAHTSVSIRTAAGLDGAEQT